MDYISLPDLFEIFSDEVTSEQWFVKTRWPDGLRCAFPKCGSDNVRNNGTHPTQPYYCRDRKRFYSVKTNSIMSGSKLPYWKWAVAIWLMTCDPRGVSAKTLVKVLKVSYPTAWHIGHRIREAMHVESDEPFAGPVEVDETYVGGRRRNQSRAQHIRNPQIPVIGLFDRATGQVSVRPIKSANKAEMQGFI